ncbi:hypothetical protein MZM54_00995 [[Brevibacterium] frigoritolerans]|nr:hypothetical protein [Peribacillus frigoritolerans]
MTIICPYCKADDGFFTKERVVGTAKINYSNKGDYLSDQSSMYDNLIHSGGKIAYCTNCHKSIGKSEDLKSGNVEDEENFC